MLIDTACLSGAILLIIGTATGMAWGLTQSGFSRALAAAMTGLPGGSATFIAVSIVAFKNDGRMNFTPHILAYAPIQLITLAAGDLDGSGRPSLVTGGFYSYPPFDRMGRILRWRPAGKP